MRPQTTTLLLCLASALGAFSKSTGDERSARIFRYGYTHTATVVQEEVVTALIPSSCVTVEPTLKPCRNARFGFREQLATTTVQQTIPQPQPTQQLPNPAQRNTANATVHTTPLSWGEYLGIVAPTVTITATNFKTTTVFNPNVVVTFSVKGCKPRYMPLDLDRCSITTSTVAYDIIPTAAYQEPNKISPTASVLNFNANTNFGGTNSIEAAEQDVLSNASSSPTQNLDNVRGI